MPIKKTVFFVFFLLSLFKNVFDCLFSSLKNTIRNFCVEIVQMLTEGENKCIFAELSGTLKAHITTLLENV